MTGKPKLTKSEFEELLKKAAERDVHTGPRDFSAEELLEAGSELGISRDTVMEVWREHEAKLAAQKAAEARLAVLPRPRGTRVELAQTPARFVLRYGASLGAKVAALFGLLLFGGMALFALRFGGSLRVAAAGTALVGVGLSLAAGFRRARLELDRQKGRFVRQVGPLGFSRRLQTPGLQVRLDQELRQINQGNITVRFLAIDDGTRTHKLLVGFSVPEQRWVASELSAWLAQP